MGIKLKSNPFWGQTARTLVLGALLNSSNFDSGPEVIKLSSYEIVGILIFMSGKNTILSLSEPKKTNFLIFLYL